MRTGLRRACFRSVAGDVPGLPLPVDPAITAEVVKGCKLGEPVLTVRSGWP